MEQTLSWEALGVSTRAYVSTSARLREDIAHVGSEHDRFESHPFRHSRAARGRFPGTAALNPEGWVMRWKWSGLDGDGEVTAKDAKAPRKAVEEMVERVGI